MKRSLATLLSLALAFALAISLVGCGGGGTTSEQASGGEGTAAEGGTGSATGGSAGSGEIATLDDFKSALEEQYGDTEWYGDITDMTMETWLGAPVLVLHVPYTTADPDYQAINDKRMAIGDAVSKIEQSVAPNVALLDGDSAIWSLFSSGGAPMDKAFDLPPAPQTAEEVSAWLKQVYGPGGIVKLGESEDWYSAITGVRYEDPWGQGMMLIVSTNLPTYNDVRGHLIEKALLTTGSPLLSDYMIEVADGSGPVGGTGGDSSLQPGYAGWQYPTE